MVLLLGCHGGRRLAGLAWAGGRVAGGLPWALCAVWPLVVVSSSEARVSVWFPPVSLSEPPCMRETGAGVKGNREDFY